MKVLVTGGAGYVGYELLRQLDQIPEVTEVIVYDNLSKGNLNFFFGSQKLNKTSFIKGDILNHLQLETALQDVEIIYHLAAFVSFPYTHEDHLRYEQVNRWGTGNIYHILCKSKTVRKLIYLSSAAVYGFKEIRDEDVAPEPANAYGRSKFEGEKFAALLQDKMQVYTFRASNVFGFNPCFRTDAVLNNFFFEALAFRKLHIYGNGEQYRPFVSLNYLVRQLVQAISNPDFEAGIYNIVQFNASLNQLKDIFTGLIPDIEYTYLDRSQSFPGLKLFSKKMKAEADMEKILQIAFADFRDAYYRQLSNA